MSNASSTTLLPDPSPTTLTFTSATPPGPTSPPPTSTGGLHPGPAPSSSSSLLGTGSVHRVKSRSKARAQVGSSTGSIGRASAGSDGTWTRSEASLGRKQVRTRPPFAQHERDSPPTSPKGLLPVTFAQTHPPSSPSQAEQHESHHHQPSSSTSHLFHPLDRPISPLELSQAELAASTSTQPHSSSAPPSAESASVRPGTQATEGAADVGQGGVDSPPEGKRHEWWLLNKGRAALNSSKRTVAFGLDEKQASYFPEPSADGSFPSKQDGASSSYPSSPTLPPRVLPRISSSGSTRPARDSFPPSLPSSPPPKTRRSSHFPSFHIPIPRLDILHPYSAHQSKTPGWEEPYSAAPFHPVDPEEEDAKRRTRLERCGRWLIYSYWTPLVLRVVNFALTACTMGLGIRIRGLERTLGQLGITGSSPVVAIIYTPLTLLHVLLAVYLEYFGRPIGLWSLSSKLLFTSLDLLSISLWSSLLSLSLSDLLSTPLKCGSDSMRWWTNLPPPDLNVGDHNVCGFQIALVVTVAVGTVGFLVNFFVSLGRVLAKVLGRR